MAASSAAASDPAEFDVRCVIAMDTALVSPAIKPEIKLILMSAMTYFSGRVDAEISSAELEKRLMADAKALQGQPLGPLMKQCGDFMQARGKVWTGISERLKAQEESTHSS